MSVLIDISHPAHVHFFRPLAHRLIADGVIVHIVARDKDVTARLLEASGLPFEVLAMPQPGKGLLSAAVELLRRSTQLRRRIRRLGVAVVLTRNPSGVLAAIGTRATSIFDTDDGRGVGLHYWTARPFAGIITSSVHDPEDHGRAHRRYRALKAQMFLHPDRFTPDPEVRRRYLRDDEQFSVVRFSAHDASHDRRI
jgi:predicted glycosyltransferase